MTSGFKCYNFLGKSAASSPEVDFGLQREVFKLWVAC